MSPPRSPEVLSQLRRMVLKELGALSGLVEKYVTAEAVAKDLELSPRQVSDVLLGLQAEGLVTSVCVESLQDEEVAFRAQRPEVLFQRAEAAVKKTAQEVCSRHVFEPGSVDRSLSDLPHARGGRELLLQVHCIKCKKAGAVIVYLPKNALPAIRWGWFDTPPDPRAGRRILLSTTRP
jgi:hypothetical protein